MAKVKSSGDPIPEPYAPMLASVASRPFDSEDWTFELKWDGYRVLAWIDGDHVRLISRSQQDLTARFPTIAQALEKTHLTAVLDGEIVATDAAGRSNFNLLHSTQPGAVQFVVFDILYWREWDLRSCPLKERQELLRALPQFPAPVVVSDGIQGKGKDLFALAKKIGMEGIIAKKLDSAYVAGERSANWLKIKTENTEDAIVCGYASVGNDLRALLLCVPDKGGFRYAGRVGSGFKQVGKDDLLRLLKEREVSKPPILDPLPALRDARRGVRRNTKVQWVRPEIMVTARTPGWTRNRRLRQPTLVRLRPDRDVKKELY